MSEHPTFLPPILSLDGEIDKIISMLYDIFQKDFKETEVYHKNIKIVYNNKIEQDGAGKEEGFWHVITKDDKVNGRLIDNRRAERLHWAKPLIESEENNEIKIWEYIEGTRDKGIRTYIWLENYQYVVILQNKKDSYYWVTAFYVENWKRRELYKKYEKKI
jgi:hypothetical protein